jgi:tetratricopeptide (TPR) repeat protein
MIYREKGQFDDAIAYFKKALAINPESAWLYTNMGVTLQHSGQREEGYRYLHKALEKNLNIQNPPTHMDELLVSSKGGTFDTLYSQKKESSKKILIVVSAFNRKKITALSLKQTHRYMIPDCHLQVYNDQSTEYDSSFLSSYADDVIELPEKLGIDKLRWLQFRKFLDTDFDYLYLTDNDVIHDPHYLDILDTLYEKGKRKLPVSLFNSIFTSRPHMALYHKNNMFLKTTAPGISMFYNRQMVEKIMTISEKMGNVFDYLPWDNRAIAFLGLPWITPEISYLEHFGFSGMHNDNYERDRAINPTKYLQGIRDIILEYLRQKDGDEPEL